MKLKLETQDSTTILTVTESIEASHIPVLKAGLSKLFQSGKKAILLDFSQVADGDFKDSSLFQQIADLHGWAGSSDAQVIVVSANPAIGHAPTRAEGIQLLTSQLGKLLALEAKLQTELKALEQKKSTLDQKLGSAGQGDDLKKLQRQNSILKKNITEAEKVSRQFLKLRTKEPHQLPSQQVVQENLEKLIDSFLKQEGLLK